MTQAMTDRIRNGKGFIAALDQSGGSSPTALGLYGIGPDGYANEAEMFDIIHAMRSRIITSPAFTDDKVLGAILFEMTMDREIAGLPTAQYLWEERGVVPFLKIDKGIEEVAQGVRLLKPIPDLDMLLPRARACGIFGTKKRSVITAANADGIRAIVEQQFEISRTVLSYGLVPIIEPEILITAENKAEAEQILLEELLRALNDLDEDVMLKLTLPETADHYRPLVEHPRVMRFVALSGGYSLDESVRRLEQNHGVIASFSRVLVEDLFVTQTDAEFNAALAATIDRIYQASIA